MTAPDAHGIGETRLLPLLFALIACPGIILAAARPEPRDVPHGIDRFLATARNATPANARLLAYGYPGALVFYRATYMLYPRTVFSAMPTDYDHRALAPAMNWGAVLRLALIDRAGYVASWSVAVPRSANVLVRSGNGTLVEIPR